MGDFLRKSTPLIAVALLFGCKTEGPVEYGWLRVQVVTTGSDIDDHYSLYVNTSTGPQERGVFGPNDSTVLSTSAGDVHVALGDIDPNCIVSGANPRTVQVIANDTASTTITVGCVPMGAYIAIDIGFAGVDRDVDGYWVALDRDSFLVHVVDSIAFRKVLPGTHSVVLRRVAANCAVATDTLRTATFAAGDTLRLRWDVTCAEVTARRLLFSSAFSLYFNADIYVRNPHDTLPTNLTRTPAREWQPAWSPDGLRIVFVSDRTGRDEIHVMNADGTGVVQLTNAPGGNAFPTWSPDGTRIAFVSARGGRNALYVMNADGTGQTRFTTDTAAENFPDWAPDGLHVAYVRGCLECIPAFTEVYLTNGTDTTRLTSQARANYRPVWSPDGARIAFFSQERLTLMDADGSHIVRVGEAFPIERAPSWSPDSKQLAYVYYGAIHRIRFDGTGDTLLTGGGGPAWSGDGNLIAFVTLSCGPYGGCSADLAIMRTDGAQIVTLVVGAPGVDRPQWDP